MKTITFGGVTYACPFADLLPPLTAEERAELKADIDAHGMTCPIIVSSENEVIDGHNRLEIAVELGLDPDTTPIFIFEPMTPERMRAKAVELNLHRRHLTREQKREVIARRLKADPGRSNRDVAAELKVDDKTVATVRTELESTAEIPQLDAARGRDGRTRRRPAKKKAPKTAPTPPPEPKPIEATSPEPQAPTPTLSGDALSDEPDQLQAQDQEDVQREAAGPGAATVRQRGVVIDHALKAINELKRIPAYNPYRYRGPQMVLDFIRGNEWGGPPPGAKAELTTENWPELQYCAVEGQAVTSDLKRLHRVRVKDRDPNDVIALANRFQALAARLETLVTADPTTE